MIDPVGYVRHQFEEALAPFEDLGLPVTVFAAIPSDERALCVSALIGDAELMLQARLYCRQKDHLDEEILDCLWQHRLKLIARLNAASDNPQSLGKIWDGVFAPTCHSPYIEPVT